MKKIFLVISTLCMAIALCLVCFNPTKKYDFLTACEQCSQVPFENPLQQFQEIGEEFENFGDIFENKDGNWWSQFWQGTTQFFTLIWSILKAPVLLVYYVIVDIIQAFKCVTIILGFY